MLLEEEFAKEEEQRIYTAWREWKKEEGERRQGSKRSDQPSPSVRDGMQIKERWKTHEK